MNSAWLWGSVVGALLGLTGGGGGILAMPALMLGVGLTLHDAAPLALVAVGIAALIGAIDGLRKGLVRYKAALLMAGLGSMFSRLGIWLSHQLSSPVLIVIFCSLMLAIAARTVWQLLAKEVSSSPKGCACFVSEKNGRLRWTRRCAAALASLGGGAGIVTGMLGVGGGFLIVPGLRQFTDLGMQACVATSLAVIAIVSTVTAGGTLLAGAHFAPVGWMFIAATSAGMVAGRSIARELSPSMLQFFFVIAIVAVALIWLEKTI